MSMQPIVMKIALFRGDFDQARSQYSLLWLMEALCRINQSHIRQFRILAKQGKVPAPYPLLYRAGVHYEPEAGTEEWCDIPNILDSRGGTFPGSWGDCEDLACWRVAELREDLNHPIAAKPFAKWKRKPDGAYAYHALVRLPDGKLEDPSLVLGMANEPEFARLNMAQRYKEGSMTPTVRFAKIPDVVVVDNEKQGGFGKDIKAAKKATGLDKPQPGAPITGMITGKIAKGSALDFPREGGIATSNEDGIYAPISKQSWDNSIQGAAWGYDRKDVNPRDMQKLRRFQQQSSVNGHEVGFRSGYLGRLGRVGRPDSNWARRFQHISNSISYPDTL